MKRRVLTFNLLFHGAVNPAGAWNVRLPLVLDVMRGGADIIAVQEATAFQLADLEREMPDFVVVPGPESGETRMPRSLHTMGRVLRAATSRKPKASRIVIAAAGTPGDLAHSRRGEHCAILYRRDAFDLIEGNAFWLSHQPTVPGSVLRGSWLPRVVNWVRLRDRETTQPLSVFNAHLDYLPWSPPRAAQILRHSMDRHWNGEPQILMGDFNAAPKSAAYKNLSRQLKDSIYPALRDARLEAEECVGPDGTFHGGTGRIRWIGRLDRIFFRPDLRVTRVTTITHHRGSHYPSDHYPVMAEMDLPNASPVAHAAAVSQAP